jgi:Zn-dependent protease
MFLTEPPPSQADVHFRVLGVPVRVHPWFWIISLMLGLNGSGPADPLQTVLWVAVVFASILVHEMGHALVQRRFGGRPRVVLYSLGGLAICDDCDRSPSSQVQISLAGPAAGFLFAALVLLVVRGAGHQLEFGRYAGFIGLLIPHWEPFESPALNEVIFDLLYVNIFWGLVNLLPIYPLDGGRVSRELFTLSHPRRGIEQSLWLSIACAGAFAAVGLIGMQSIFTAVFFGYLAYANYQTLQSYQQHWH